PGVAGGQDGGGGPGRLVRQRAVALLAAAGQAGGQDTGADGGHRHGGGRDGRHAATALPAVRPPVGPWIPRSVGVPASVPGRRLRRGGGGGAEEAQVLLAGAGGRVLRQGHQRGRRVDGAEGHRGAVIALPVPVAVPVRVPWTSRGRVGAGV